MRQLTPAIQESVMKIIASAVQAKQRGDGKPFIVGHLVTNRCMCKCASCLWRDNDATDVPLEDLKRFYTEAAEQGFVAAGFTGGEPFLRKDLGELARFVKEEAKMSILLFNTGWFLEKRMDEVLPHISAMIVSVDSAQAERHDEIRGLPGLFDRLCAGVRLARERYPDVPIHLNTCVQQGIGEEIDGLLALAKDLGVPISFDVITEQRNGGDSTSTGMPLEELQALCSTLLEHKRNGAPIVNSERYFDYFVQGRLGYACHLPKLVMFVDGRGNAEYCLDLNRPLGNIREMSLVEIMEQPRFKSLRVDAERCSSCNSPTMVDLSHVWQNPQLIYESGGIAFG